MPDTTTQTLNYSLTQQKFTLTTHVEGYSLGDISQCRLFDTFQVTPHSSGSERELQVAMHVLSCQWARRGSFWLETSAGLGGTFSTASGASGSAQLNAGAFWQPMKSLKLSFVVTVNGTVDKDGARATVDIEHSSIEALMQKSVGMGLGLNF